MTLTVQSKYLVFPVNTEKEQVTLTLSENGSSLCSLRIRMDTTAPNFFAYVNVERFLGKTLTLALTQNAPISYREADTLEYEKNFDEPNRPQVHFTVKNGWLNDPNGLVRIGDTYHLFYQFTPTAPMAESMHWGHATSQDLLHWQEDDPLLFPDETGDKWSGSAIIDENNLSGLGNDTEPPVLLYYTSTAPFAQHVAYSTDALKTVRKYGSTPVVPHIMRQNRDPKVVFCEERGDYLMAIHLVTTRFLLLCSKDLLHWEPLQELFVEDEGECPDLFPLCDQHGTRRWIFIGARSRYLVGNMTTNGFAPLQEAQSLYFGGVVQAGQTFSGLANGRVVRMDWDRWEIDASSFAGQMSIPYDLSLREQDGKYWLCATPIKELKAIFEKEICEKDLRLTADSPFSVTLEPKPYHLTLKVDEFSDICLSLTVFGCTLTLDGISNTVTLGKMQAPLRTSGSALDLCLVLDRCSIECFLDGGAIYLGGVTPDTVSDYTQSTFHLLSEAPCQIDVLTFHPLHSIWQ